MSVIKVINIVFTFGLLLGLFMCLFSANSNQGMAILIFCGFMMLDSTININN